MIVITPIPLPWNVLRPSYLDAFDHAASDGSLTAPWMEDEGPGRARTPVLDRDHAQDLEASSTLVLREIESYWSTLTHAERPLHRFLPEMGDWGLETFRPDMASFAKSSRRVVISRPEPNQFRYSVSDTMPGAEVSAQISIQSPYYEVHTDFYSLRVRFRDFGKAVRFAWYVSALVYDCQQYQPADELGPLMFRPNETAAEREISHSYPNLPVIPGSILNPHEEVVFASARSMMEGGVFREPLAHATITSAAEGGYDVSFTWYRPPERGDTRMPLAPRLQRAVWDPIRARITAQNR